MYSRNIFLLFFGISIIKLTSSQLCPELASSHVATGPINIETKDAKFIATKKPLLFLTPFTEYFTLNNTGKTVDIFRIAHTSDSDTCGGTLRGGLLGDDVYVYFKFTFYWNNNSSKHGIYSYTTVNGEGGTRLEALVFYYNKKYKSYENALKHSDGILQAAFRINVFDVCVPNTLFAPFKVVLKTIQKAGEHVCAKASFTYFWFIFYPKHTLYYAYRGTYIDETGKAHPATTIVIASNPLNYISYLQFKETFGSLENFRGKVYDHVALQSSEDDVSVVQSSGISIINLPE